MTEFLEAHPTVHIHFTPTYSSWLNQIELWFSKIARDLIYRGVFTSTKQLARSIRRSAGVVGRRSAEPGYDLRRRTVTHVSPSKSYDFPFIRAPFIERSWPLACSTANTAAKGTSRQRSITRSSFLDP